MTGARLATFTSTNPISLAALPASVMATRQSAISVVDTPKVYTKATEANHLKDRKTQHILELVVKATLIHTALSKWL